ncbi:MAG: adenosylcobinamide-GDP ribazoletransferase [Muribaculaceae bacterium]|nr:adenosylcobinamide-GDP ribazoletransferase [Muribaculaceae bacterium]
MQEKSEHISWYDRPWAAMIFFTRLPLWRLYQPPAACYSSVVEYWPLAGWLIGCIMAATLYASSLFLPYAVAVLLSIAMRLLVTGALHEDGLADFFDGMGGGTDRDRILAIMKDSHIGTYGVLGLIIYELLLAVTLFVLPPMVAALAIIAAAPYARMLSGVMILLMPYARSETESKNKTVYRQPRFTALVSQSLQGLLPLAFLLAFTRVNAVWFIVLPIASTTLLLWIIWHKLHGYTGDCCGAVCLLVELVALLSLTIS